MVICCSMDRHRRIPWKNMTAPHSYSRFQEKRPESTKKVKHQGVTHPKDTTNLAQRENRLPAQSRICQPNIRLWNPLEPLDI